MGCPWVLIWIICSVIFWGKTFSGKDLTWSVNIWNEWLNVQHWSQRNLELTAPLLLFLHNLGQISWLSRATYVKGHFLLLGKRWGLWRCLLSYLHSKGMIMTHNSRNLKAQRLSSFRLSGTSGLEEVGLPILTYWGQLLPSPWPEWYFSPIRVHTQMVPCTPGGSTSPVLSAPSSLSSYPGSPPRQVGCFSLSFPITTHSLSPLRSIDLTHNCFSGPRWQALGGHSWSHFSAPLTKCCGIWALPTSPLEPSIDPPLFCPLNLAPLFSPLLGQASF